MAISADSSTSKGWETLALDIWTAESQFDNIFKEIPENGNSTSITDNCVDINILRSNLYADLLARLNASKAIKKLKHSICQCGIKNWPDFVSFNLNNWDERDLNEIRFALPDITFKKNSLREKQRRVNVENFKIKSLLLGKLTSQNPGVATKNKNIKWSKYHLMGWPVGVSDYSHSRNFARHEMLAISRGIDKISFVPILAGQERNIIYTDGIVVGSTILAKKRKLSDVLYSNNDDNNDSNLENTPNLIIENYSETDQEMQDNDMNLDSAVSKLNSESSHLSQDENSFLSEKDAQFFEREIQILSEISVDLDQLDEDDIFEREIIFEMSDKITSSSSYDLNFSANIFDSTVDNFENVPDNGSFNSINLNALRSNLHAELIICFKVPEDINLKHAIRHYEITNWPDFVSFDCNQWNELDIRAIRSALPNITFTDLLPSEKKINSLKLITAEKSKLNSLLRDKFMSQYPEVTCARINWSKYNVNGWPEGVLYYPRYRNLKRPEMLTISRSIDNFSFVPILRDEKRTKMS